MIQETSLKTYLELPMKALQDQLVSILESGAKTDQELGAIMSKAASTISGVRRPLVKKGEVEEAGKRRCSITGNVALVWRIARKGQQTML